MTRYGRLFAGLPPLSVDGVELSGVGRPGGPCDLGVDASGDDSLVDAVWPFFGQFVAHDVAADRTPLDPLRRPAEITNFRTPSADLECLYGAGPSGAAYLYEHRDPVKLLLGASGLDLPRNQEGIALIGDARNDSHLFVSQLHLAFARLHNRLVDRLRRDGVDETELFDQARRATTWHYQHVLLREFLPLVVGIGMAAELLDEGPRFYDGSAVPLEFAAAAYRYGHAQIRQRYRVNGRFGPVPVFPDLVGFGPVCREHAVDWSLLIGPHAQKAKRIDMRLARPLLELPRAVSGVCRGDDHSSLATRDLVRGGLVGLPSGEAVARAMGATPLDAGAIALDAYGWRYETPLWLYVLREAEVLCGGERLGPVGGRIVGEVLVGIVDRDPESFRSVEPAWQPFLGEGGDFSLADVLLPERANEPVRHDRRHGPASRRMRSRHPRRDPGPTRTPPTPIREES
jgi:hypothetical protein